MNVMAEKILNIYSTDGADHVRIHPNGETVLGRILTPNWKCVFFIPRLGEFLTPQCFATWLVLGNEEARHDTSYQKYVNMDKYVNFVMYAKLHQLMRMKKMLTEEDQKGRTKLPFIMYKTHSSGVRELHRWIQYPSSVKDITCHILENSPKVEYDWEGKYPGLREEVNNRVKKMIEGR